MAGQTPNSQNIERVAAGTADSTSVIVHPEYMYWRWEWRKLRDVIAGQREVKRQTTTYLKALQKQDPDDYLHYLERATFYNMTRQTLNTMVGQVFARDPILVGVSKKFKDAMRLKFGKDGSGHVNFSKTVITEQISMGRYGVLVDAPAEASTTPTSFAVGYSAENILDWSIEEIGGEYKLTRVLLREFKREAQSGPTQQNPWIGSPTGQAKAGSVQNRNGISTRAGRGQGQQLVRPSSAFIEAYTYRTVYRELLLEQPEVGAPVYVQHIYNDSPSEAPASTLNPVLRGSPLNFIPFQFFGATGNSPDVEQSPLLDIADLNISHYRTYAELEWGRMYTALPVYYAQGNDGESASEYHIGPSMVWEVPAGEPPGILEYKGEGLKALETALDTKEKQIAAIGGRMMPGNTSKGSASPEEAARASQNEQALLLHVIQAAESGLVNCIRWWLMWRDQPLAQTEGVEYRLNRIFGDAMVDGRVLRALQQLVDDGMAPIDVIYNALTLSGWLDPDVTVDDFKVMLDDPESFPNRPDMQARQRGFTTRAQELDQSNIAREADQADEEIDLQDREVTIMEEAPPPLPPTPGSPGGAAVPSKPKAKKPKGK
jgi:hypothetical protein